MKFLFTSVLLIVTRPVLSALQAKNVQRDLSITRVSLGRDTTLNATAPKYATLPLQLVSSHNSLKS